MGSIEKFVFDAFLEEAENLGVNSEGLTEFGCGCVNAYNKILAAALKHVRNAELNRTVEQQPLTQQGSEPSEILTDLGKALGYCLDRKPEEASVVLSRVMLKLLPC